MIKTSPCRLNTPDWEKKIYDAGVQWDAAVEMSKEDWKNEVGLKLPDILVLMKWIKSQL